MHFQEIPPADLREEISGGEKESEERGKNHACLESTQNLVSRSKAQISKLELGKRLLQIRSRARLLLLKCWRTQASRLNASLKLEQRGTLCGDRSKESWTGGSLAHLAPASRAVLTGDGWLHIVPTRHCEAGAAGGTAPGELREVSGLFLHFVFPLVFQPKC